MDPATSDQNTSNQPPLPPRQDQLDQTQTPRDSSTEQARLEELWAEAVTEGRVSLAIMDPGDSTITLTDEMRADLERCLALPRPAPDDDDFADEPLPTRYDPETSTPYN